MLNWVSVFVGFRFLSASLFQYLFKSSSVSWQTCTQTENHGADIAIGLLATVEAFPFVLPLARVLNQAMKTCRRAKSNKPAAKQFMQRLEGVEKAIKDAVGVIGEASQSAVGGLVERLSAAIERSTEVIACWAEKKYIEQFWHVSAMESELNAHDKGIVSILQEMSALAGSSGSTQSNLAVKAYQLFDPEKFLREYGGCAMVLMKEDKLGELSSRLGEEYIFLLWC